MVTRRKKSDPMQMWMTYAHSWGGPKIHKVWCQFGENRSHGKLIDADKIPEKDALDQPVVDCKKCGGRN